MVKIFFGSQTGNAQNLADVIGTSLDSENIENEVLNFLEVAPEEIHSMDKILIVTSTYGDGEAPDNASEWLSYLKFSEDLNLAHLKYAVIGLGDTYYPHFCQCGKDFDEYLSKSGAHAMLKRLDCDLYYEEQYAEWLQEFIGVLKS
jgi:sulfite reductase (NADPH) flavoprotein alpha-component